MLLAFSRKSSQVYITIIAKNNGQQCCLSHSDFLGFKKGGSLALTLQWCATIQWILTTYIPMKRYLRYNFIFRFVLNFNMYADVRVLMHSEIDEISNGTSEARRLKWGKSKWILGVFADGNCKIVVSYSINIIYQSDFSHRRTTT